MKLPLAASEFELVIGIIVFVFWVIAAIAGKLKGALNRPNRPGGGPSPMERIQQEIAEQLRRMQGEPAGRTPPPLPQRPPEQPQQRRRGKRVQPVAAPPPPPAERVVEASPITAAAKPVPPTVAAPTIRRWLTPATLRQQFILTELFQPPLSMREEQR